MAKITFIVLALSAFANAQTLNSQRSQIENLFPVQILYQYPANLNNRATILEKESAIPEFSLLNSQSSNRYLPLTGILSNDLFALDPVEARKDSVGQVESRSALKPGFFSLLIPGAGQAYNGTYMKAAGFFAVEIAGWAVNAIWNKKGNDETNAFRVYADGTAADHYQDGHYNVYRYAQWIVNNYQQLEQNCGTSSSNQTIISDQINNVLITKTYNPTEAPWMQVNWSALNAVENAMGGDGPENSFSHWLFPYGDVEYYKCIAKYPQFRPGWSDENLAYLTYDELRSLTPESNYYENMRGKATGYYNVGLAGVCVVIANHFASAAEAMIWAHAHQKLIETAIDVEPLPLAGDGYETKLKLAINF